MFGDVPPGGPFELRGLAIGLDPAFLFGAARADADGNLWIRTTALEHGQPVYDIVSAAGILIDRVQLPASRAIAGVGPGVIYLAAVDLDRVVHLERAAIGRK